MHSSKMHFRLKVPSGEYGSIFVAFKRFFIMPAFQVMQLMSYLSCLPAVYIIQPDNVVLAYIFTVLHFDDLQGDLPRIFKSVEG